MLIRSLTMLWLLLAHLELAEQFSISKVSPSDRAYPRRSKSAPAIHTRLTPKQTNMMLGNASSIRKTILLIDGWVQSLTCFNQLHIHQPAENHCFHNLRNSYNIHTLDQIATACSQQIAVLCQLIQRSTKGCTFSYVAVEFL